MLDTKEIHWFVIHTRPNQEKKLKGILEAEQAKRENILDFYCPLNTTVRVQRGKKEELLPLFAGRLFVLTTQETAQALLTERYPDGYLEYDKIEKRVMTIPELQMLFFMDFNENYPEKVLVLERPYRDYAFNAKNNEPNEAIKVIDGPFKGKTGYLVRFRGNRRLVFRMEDMAISIPDIWDYHLTRLHNSDGDRQSRHTLKARIVDFIIGMLQGCGFIDHTPQAFAWFIETLIKKPSFAALTKEIETLHAGKETYRLLEERIKNLAADEASQILSLANYIETTPNAMDEFQGNLSLRPFLTPTSGIDKEPGKAYSIVRRKDFSEIITEVSFPEDTFNPKEDTSMEKTASYFAHVGIIRKKNRRSILFVNFDKILKEYFLLGGEAKVKQLTTFKNYCPQLHQVLKGESNVKAEKDLPIGMGEKRSVLCLYIAPDAEPSDKEIWEQPQVKSAINELTETVIKICQEINSSTHLAIWRKYLRSIWLHL